MLIRLVVENVFSFGDRAEFNTIANNSLRTLNHHKIETNGLNTLKLASIYGANASGKSNLINALRILQVMIVEEKTVSRLNLNEFKFNEEQKNQILAVEFYINNSIYYFGIEFNKNRIITEELYESGLGKKKDKLIYERTTNKELKTSIRFSEKVNIDDKVKIIKEVLLKSFVKPNSLVFRRLSALDEFFFQDIEKAYSWFYSKLHIITPDSKLYGLAQHMDKDKKFKNYALKMMKSFDIGISSLETFAIDLDEFIGKDNESEVNKFIEKLENSDSKMIGTRTDTGEEVIIVKEDDKYLVKTLKAKHVANNISKIFDLDEESDGTLRLLDFIPVFKETIETDNVFIVDELERSIHPLLIKQLIEKFSSDKNTKGQLIFTSHESNLLDQKIFRKDEIWFVEKDKCGSSDVYSLNDFKEHTTIDIRKGYLSGRYGSIPFLGNLKDLNWYVNDSN